ncbi:MAG: DUF393 domain-containing protein [Verrucomicrobiota bacterium]
MPRQRHWVIYDGDCGFCRGSIRLLRALDWFDRFACIPWQQAASDPCCVKLSEPALTQAMHCVSVSGVVNRSARAVRFIALRCPLTSLPALLLWVPGTMWLAERSYHWVAQHRQGISRILRIRH